MFAKIETTPDGRITCASYTFDPALDHANFPGILINDGLIDNLIRDNPAYVVGNYWFDKDYQAVMPRPQNLATIHKTTITADGVDSAIISDIPVGCSVVVDGSVYTVDDGVFEFSVRISGTYTVTLELFPYLSKSFEVTAT